MTKKYSVILYYLYFIRRRSYDSRIWDDKFISEGLIDLLMDHSRGLSLSLKKWKRLHE
uniref:Uncharacterized protein n=1 Tax=Lepeophtheirus salmonis TaxID=72036 RepID=A0A0K2U690_LEPSM